MSETADATQTANANDAQDASKPARERRAFLLRKAHSLSGVIPLGAFLVEHLWTNATALGGRNSFDHAVDEIQAIPGLPALEVVGIFLPLAFHAIYGVKLSLESKPNANVYVTGRNWLYVLQRVTGIVTFVFVCAHLWEFRVQKWLFGMSSHSFFDTLASHLASTNAGVPLIAFGYVIALGSATFHFANGLSGFAMSWGITATKRALRRVMIASTVLGAILFFLGLSTVVFFATGTRLFPVPPAGKSGLEAPCPEPK